MRIAGIIRAVQSSPFPPANVARGVAAVQTLRAGGGNGGEPACLNACLRSVVVSQTKTRSITTTRAYGGLACPTLTFRGNCNTRPCLIDCVESWNDWSTCTKTCGTGAQTRTFDVDTTAAHGGDKCPTEQGRLCKRQACPVDRLVGHWTGHGKCSKSCTMYGHSSRANM
jgi:hypothetical protein